MQILSLADAKARGLSHYFTGIPCKNGHVDKRHVKNRGCFTCNKNRVAEFEKRARAENPNYRRADHLRLSYGLTIDDVQTMLNQQGGNCATCESAFVGQPHIDHCHTTGKVRGLLCGPCNRALGMVKDQVDVLLRMVDYLRAGDRAPQRSARNG